MVRLADSQQLTEQTIRRFYDDTIQKASTIHPSLERLLQEISRVTFAGGKRLRPHLVYVGYGSYNQSAAYVASAYELLHLALLVHDDIIDRDTVRHSVPTIHAQYDQTHYAPHIQDPAERQHFSMSAALLAGDILLSAAHELLAKASVDTAISSKLSGLLSTSVLEVAAGELIDTEAAFIPDIYDPLVIYRYKTAGYSFIGPLLSGAVLRGNLSEQTFSALRQYATVAGIAFQIHDDMLGIFGNEEQTGKSTSGDLREGKRTLLIEMFLAVATAHQRDEFMALFGKKSVSDEDIIHMKELLTESGARKKVQAIEHEYTVAAQQAAASIDSTDLRADLLDLLEKLTKRNA